MNMKITKISYLALPLISFFTLNSSFAASSFETIPAGEKQEIQAILETLSKQVELERQEKGFALRDAHAKQHGCVKAEVKINNDLPQNLRSSVFTPGKSYKSWIRFSNGSGKSQDDSVGDGRGMALKIIEAGTAGYQDFLMINHPVFFVRNVKDYVGFTQAAADGNPLKFFTPLNPFNWHVKEMLIAAAITTKKVNQLLGVQYWTMTPYLYNENQAAKFNVRPCTPVNTPDSSRTGENFLKNTMSVYLEKNDACFILSAQLFKSQKKTPIEDPIIEWEESDSPSIDLAKITIPAQKFTSQAQMDFCENLSFTPWNFSSEHKPLGGINRARKAIYDGISKLRHELNGTNTPLPNGNEEFN